jgi:hypothetical protein
MNNRSIRRFIAASAISFAFAAVLAAQSFTGGLRGLVQDPGGANIPGATITLTNEASAVVQTTSSNGSGEYSFPQVPPASYSISVESTGFKKLERKGIVIAAQETVNLDLRLDLGQMTESVVITGDAPVVETANAQQGQDITNQQINDLPNLGRNTFLMSRLTNGVVPAGDPRWNRFEDQIGSAAVSVAGGPVRGNNYLIDGISITTSQNLPEIIPTMEAVQEMKLQANTYDASMGRTGGGVFNTVLKTGSNTFHGDVFGYLRQTSWGGNTFFNNAAGLPLGNDDWRNWGASFGGPVILPKYNGRNKTFFYVATEAYRQHQPNLGQFAVPTAAERNGDFSQAGYVIYNPASTRACLPNECPAGVSQIRLPFTGNIIPPNMMNPVAMAILNPGAALIPLPQVNGVKTIDSVDYSGADYPFDRGDEYTYKLEEDVTQTFHLTGSFLYYKSHEPNGNPLGSAAGGSGSYVLTRHVDATQINATDAVNASTVVSMRWGFNRFPNIYASPGSGYNLASLQLPPNYVSNVQVDQFPGITISNAGTAIGYSGTQNVNYWSENASASVNKTAGRHNLAMGFDFRTLNAGGAAYGAPAGTFSFNGVFSQQYPTAKNNTGADWADFLMGYPSSGSIQTTTPLYFNAHYFGGFIQDDIRVTNKLTVNAGIRYEFETGVSERQNGELVGFNKTAVNPIVNSMTPGATVDGVSIVPNGQLMFAGVNGNPTSTGNPQHTKFGPRVGAAYQVRPKTVIRGGFGIFYSPTFFGVDSVTSPGYVQTTSYIASTNGNATPFASLSNPFPTGIVKPAGNSAGQQTALGQTFSYVDQNRTQGHIYQFSFDIQQELPGNIGLEIGYIGSRSYDMLAKSDGTSYLPINQVPSQYLGLGSALTQSVANPFFGAPGAAGVIGSATTTAAQLLMPYPEYGAISENTNVAHAKYDSLILKVQKRLTKGLTFLSALTWSRNEDNYFATGSSNAFNGFSGSTPPSAPQNIYNLGAEWALASTNVPLRFTTSWTYMLPFGKGQKFLSNANSFVNYAVNGWSINGVAIIQQGFPLFVFQVNQNTVIGTADQRPNATGISPQVSGSLEQNLNNYINPAAFSAAPVYTFGNLSRDISMRGPGEANWDISLFKDFKIKERFNGQFRAEALNAFNTPLFANPDTEIGTANFGKVVYQTNNPRQMQLGIRLSF